MKTQYLDKNVSKKVQEVAAWTGLIVRACQDRYISYTWRFP